tara:strand:+ start:511 stop:684 length:174 start_codon:yes stop_codon:yes gene_type:complete
MKTHFYSIVDQDGYILYTIKSQPTNRNFDDEARVSITPILPIISDMYGSKIYYTEDK